MEVKQELQIEESDYILDLEDAEDLLADCFYFIKSIIERNGNPKWVSAEGIDLLQRLSEGLGWDTTH